VHGVLPRTRAPRKAILNAPFQDKKEPHARVDAQRSQTLTQETGAEHVAPPHILHSVMRKTMSKVEVFHCRPKSPSYATPPESFLISN